MKKKLCLLSALTLLIGVTPVMAEENNNKVNELKTQIESKENELKELKQELEKLTANSNSNKNDSFFNKWHEFDTFKINFTNARIGQDVSGTSALVLTYDWENTGTEAQSPYLSFSLKAFQDGVETEAFIIVMEANVEEGQKEVKPNGKISGAETAVGITDTNKPLVLELNNMFSLDNKNVVETTINLAELQ